MKNLIKKVLTPIALASALFFANPQGIKAEDQNPIVPSTFYISGKLSKLDSLNKDIEKIYGPIFMLNAGGKSVV